MERAEAISLLNELMVEVDSVRRDTKQFSAWRRRYCAVLDRIYGPESQQLAHLEGVNYAFHGISYLGDNTPHVRAFDRGLQEAREVLRTIAWEVEQFGIPDRGGIDPLFALRMIETICKRFHAVCHQIRTRHDDRASLDVADEYDVQDLLHALLTVHFDDIRSEEWTPSYAGSASRLDFLLKKERIVVECKKTRKGLNARKVGEQLLIDIARYRSHPNCSVLVCFVYDPEARIANPSGLESDLSCESEEFSVKVIISPK